MIVVEGPGGTLLVVRQPDHARASAVIARAWRRPHDLPEPAWAQFLDAVARHDDGWAGAERQPHLHPDGKPVDFKNWPTRPHISIWRRSIAATEDQPYVALLIAQHARWLYTHLTPREAEDHELAQRFVDEMTQRIDGMICRAAAAGDALAVEPHRLDAGRRLLTFLDALTLWMIGAIAIDSPTGPLPFGARDQPLTLARRDSVITMEPWPLAQPELHVQAPALRLRQQRFPDPQTFAHALGQAEPVELRWTLQPRSTTATFC